MNGPVAILFDRLGPYHLARLRACARVLSVQAVELCGQSLEYQWDPVEDRALARMTLFPGRDSAAVGGQEMRQRLFNALDEVRPSAVGVPGWATAAALAALEWCHRRRRPAVVMSESTAGDELRRPWKEWVKRRIVALAAAGLVGGGPHRDYLSSLGMPSERIFLGYDVVDNAHFDAGSARARTHGEALRAALGLPARYFLASNRFVEKKNLAALLAAYAAYRLASGGEAWPLVLLGDGPLRNSLERQRTALGLDPHVLLPGFKQYADLPAYYAFAGGFVHASTTEPWGLVVNEAMACGLPVLVSEHCGCAPDLVAPGQNGWTFDPHDPSAITTALQRLAGLPEAERAAMGQASRARIAAWTPEVFAEGMARAVGAARTAPVSRLGLLDRSVLRAVAARL